MNKSVEVDMLIVSALISFHYLELTGAGMEKTLSGSEETSGSGFPTAHHVRLGEHASELLSRGPYATHNIGLKLDCEPWFFFLPTSVNKPH